ncbi:hypothetical protein, partial [Vibrio crassostreae]
SNLSATGKVVAGRAFRSRHRGSLRVKCSNFLDNYLRMQMSWPKIERLLANGIAVQGSDMKKFTHAEGKSRMFTSPTGWGV